MEEERADAEGVSERGAAEDVFMELYGRYVLEMCEIRLLQYIVKVSSSFWYGQSPYKKLTAKGN